MYLYKWTWGPNAVQCDHALANPVWTTSWPCAEVVLHCASISASALSTFGTFSSASPRSATTDGRISHLTYAEVLRTRLPCSITCRIKIEMIHQMLRQMRHLPKCRKWLTGLQKGCFQRTRWEGKKPAKRWSFYSKKHLYYMRVLGPKPLSYLSPPSQTFWQSPHAPKKYVQ